MNGSTILRGLPPFFVIVVSYYVKSDVTLFTALVLINRFGNLSPKPSIYYKLTATELLVFATVRKLIFSPLLIYGNDKR